VAAALQDELRAAQQERGRLQQQLDQLQLQHAVLERQLKVGGAAG
jgi:predicted  nucleic acid-binding Zn-ribbon protein